MSRSYKMTIYKRECYSHKPLPDSILASVDRAVDQAIAKGYSVDSNDHRVVITGARSAVSLHKLADLLDPRSFHRSNMLGPWNVHVEQVKEIAEISAADSCDIPEGLGGHVHGDHCPVVSPEQEQEQEQEQTEEDDIRQKIAEALRDLSCILSNVRHSSYGDWGPLDPAPVTMADAMEIIRIVDKLRDLC